MKTKGMRSSVAALALLAVATWALPGLANAGDKAKRAGQAPLAKPAEKEVVKTALTRVGLTPTDKELGSVPTLGAPRALTAVIDVSIYDSRDGYGTLSNDVAVIDVAAAVGLPSGTPVIMTGVGWDVSIQTVAANSWLSDSVVYFDDNITPDGMGLHLTPGYADSFSGTGTYASGGILDLSDNGIPDVVLPNGMLRLEFYEGYDDAANPIDANYNGPSTITVEVLDPSATGACCDDVSGGCANTTPAGCPEQRWFAGETCGSFTCPVPAVGDTCALPIVVDFGASLPYSDIGQTTCARVNDYSNTCLLSYDGGEDIIYQLVVPSSMCVNVTMTSNATWVGMAIDDECPLNTTTCLWKVTSTGANLSLTNITMAAGTYYLMLDTYPAPNCIPSFTLNISQCPTGGACCHADGSCDDVPSAGDCVAPGDLFKGVGTACATVTCPSPGDDCDPPIVVNLPADLPYLDDDQSTCGRLNDYSNTCLGSYDGGEDIIYELVAATDTCVDINLTSNATWVGMAVDPACPLNATTCLAKVSSSAGNQTIMALSLPAGTYYLMVDTYPAPNCISNFDLNITQCPLGGACCHYDGSCDDVGGAGECSAPDDVYKGDGTSCATVYCPPPPPDNDQCPGKKLDCNDVLTGQTTVSALNDYNDTGVCTGFNQPGADVAYELTLPYEGTVTVTVQNVVGFDPAFYVVTDCADPTACIAGADEGYTGGDETATFIAVAGTYYIIVDTYSSTGVGTFDIAVQCVQSPEGACCIGGGCVIDTEDGCVADGGTYAGDNTTCSGSVGGDCNSNGVIDKCDIVNGMADCQPNGILDVCEVPPIGTGPDCQGDGIPDECQLADEKDIVLSEGFEGTVPPATWTAVVNNPFTWEIGTYLPYAGLQYATCYFDEDYTGTQDEWIVSPQLIMTGTVTLAGYSNGSYYWGISPYDNYDLEAWVIIGTGVNDGDDILLGQIDTDTWPTTNWAWTAFTYNFASPGTPFRIGFRYYGYDGAQASVDAVTVEGQAGPLPNDCNENQVPDECDPPVCGNNCLEGGVGSTAEECDGTEDEACPGQCYPPGHAYQCRCPFCGDGVVGPGEECDGGDCCTPTCTFKPSTTVCRAAAGACDAVEYCTGSDAACPADGFLPNTTVCRAAAGVCDAVEYCSGTGAACPADGYLTDVCRASTGPCDPAESCPGTGVDCPTNVVITACINGDGCCPAGCNAGNDNNCVAVCGNSVREGTEECDGTDAAACPGECRADCTCPPTGAIPAASTWGLVVLALLLLAGAKVYFGRRSARVAG